MLNKSYFKKGVAGFSYAYLNYFKKGGSYTYKEIST